MSKRTSLRYAQSHISRNILFEMTVLWGMWEDENEDGASTRLIPQPISNPSLPDRRLETKNKPEDPFHNLTMEPRVGARMRGRLLRIKEKNLIRIRFVSNECSTAEKDVKIIFSTRLLKHLIKKSKKVSCLRFFFIEKTIGIQ